MIETHDLFLRALAVPVAKKKKKKKKKPADTEEDESYAADEQKWPEYVIAFDTESRVALGQSLTFGVYRLSRLVGQSYEAIEEGVFYGGNLPAKDLNVLKTYMETAVSDVPSFPPRFPLYSRSEFMEKVFWHALKKWGATIVGFNLPYDLSRLALAWKEGSKGEWSLIMEQYADGNENMNYPRILITPIDSKKAIIQLVRPCKRKLKEKSPARQWKDAGERIHFIDCRTMLWSLYNKSYSLKSACDNKKGPFKEQNLRKRPAVAVWTGV